MTILVVNNYFKPKNRNRVDQILEALRECGETNHELKDFRNISKQEIKGEFDAVILSGSSAHLRNPEHLSWYEEEIQFIKRVNIPLLGICFGHQLIGKAFGSEIESLPKFIRDFEEVEILEPDEIFSSWKRGEKITVCESHQDYVASLPENFTCLARSKSCEIEAMKHNFKPIYGVQAHIERTSDKHPDGRQILQNFLKNVVKRKNIRIWKISPGKGACQWKTWKLKGVMAIVWVYEGFVENLRMFKNLYALERALSKGKDHYGGKLNVGYAANQLWTFWNEVKVGDIVVSYGHYSILDIGKVEGEYYLRKDTLYENWELYGNRRKVKWFGIGPVKIKNVRIKQFMSKNRTIYEITDDATLDLVRELLQKSPEFMFLEGVEKEIRKVVGLEPEVTMDIDHRRIAREIRRAKKRIMKLSIEEVDIERELKKIRFEKFPERIKFRGRATARTYVELHAPTDLKRCKVGNEFVYLPPKTDASKLDVSLIKKFRSFLRNMIEAMTNPEIANKVIQISVEEPYRDAHRVRNGIVFNANNFARNKSLFYWVFTAAREVAYLIHRRRDERHMKLMRSLVVRALGRFFQNEV